MTDQETTTGTTTSARRWGAAAALVAAGLAGGIVIAGTVSANAADGTPTPSTSASSGAVAGQGAAADQSKPQRSDETLLTGDTADKVEAAALAAYPGATIERVETDSDGVYEAHLVTADGTHLVVAVDKAFAVTGSQETGAGRGGGPGGGGGGETPLTGDTADKVEAAVLAEYPGATVERLETDNGGVYEAHIVTAEGTHLVVAVDKAFAVTGSQEMTGRGRPADGSAPAPSASPTA